MSVAAHLLVLTVSVAAPASAGVPATSVDAILSPSAIAVSGDRVYVADFDHDRVHVFTRAGAFVRAWGASGAAVGQLRGPAGLAVSAAGMVVVADLDNRRIQTFTSDGDPVGAWPAGVAPCGVAIHPDGTIYATDLDAGMIRCFTADGAPLREWRGEGPAALNEPWGIAVTPGGELVVADHGNDRIQRFSSAGEPLGAWGERGSGDGQLLGPMGVAVAADGAIVVSDLLGTRVQRFDSVGRLLSVWRIESEDAADVPIPGVALDVEGNVVIADAGRRRVTWLDAPSAPTAASAARGEFALLGVATVPGGGPVTLRMTIPARGELSAEVFSLDGRRIAQVPAAACDPGTRDVVWDARSDRGAPAPSGVYFVRVRLASAGGDQTRNARVVLVR